MLIFSSSVVLANLGQLTPGVPSESWQCWEWVESLAVGSLSPEFLWSFVWGSTGDGKITTYTVVLHTHLWQKSFSLFSPSLPFQKNCHGNWRVSQPSDVEKIELLTERRRLCRGSVRDPFHFSFFLDPGRRRELETGKKERKGWWWGQRFF